MKKSIPTFSEQLDFDFSIPGSVETGKPMPNKPRNSPSKTENELIDGTKVNPVDQSISGKEILQENETPSNFNGVN